MTAINLVIEPTTIDYSSRYHFHPTKDGLCQMSRKGQIVLHRRLVNAILGINFSRTALKVVEIITIDEHIHGLVLKPVLEQQPERVTIARFKYTGLLALNMLFYRLNLNYKEIKFSFISELVTLEEGTTGIQLLIIDRRPWP